MKRHKLSGALSSALLVCASLLLNACSRQDLGLAKPPPDAATGTDKKLSTPPHVFEHPAAGTTHGPTPPAGTPPAESLKPLTEKKDPEKTDEKAAAPDKKAAAA